jgi:acetyl esterase/lipase
METLIFVLVAIGLILAVLAWRWRAPDHSQFDTPVVEPVISDDKLSPEHDSVVARLAEFHNHAEREIQKSRKQMEELFYRDVDAEITPVDVDGVPGEWVIAEGADPDQRLLYLHGGAFRVGSPRSHRYLTDQLSRRCGVAVLAVDYRMQPEYKTVDCHHDARKAYRWILENGPSGPGEPRTLFVAGDSAGGNLTLSVIAWARDQSLRPVDGAVAFAPLTDATLSSPTWKANLATDPFLGPGVGPVLKLPRFFMALMSRISGGAPTNDPMLSPLFGDLHDLPDILIQVGRDEMLFGDAQRYTNKATAQGSNVTLQAWPKMVHVFQGFPELPETDDALSRVADFIRQLKGRNEHASQAAG